MPSPLDNMRHFPPAHLSASLCNAAKIGDLPALSTLLNQGADPLLPDPDDADQHTPLMIASDYGHEACVEALLPLSTPLAKSCHGHTALMFACWAKADDSCAKLLLPCSNVYARNNCGDNALDSAAKSRSNVCVDLLLPYYAADFDALARAAHAARANHYPGTGARIDSFLAETRALAEREAIAEILPCAPSSHSAAPRI